MRVFFSGFFFLFFFLGFFRVDCATHIADTDVSWIIAEEPKSTAVITICLHKLEKNPSSRTRELLFLESRDGKTAALQETIPRYGQQQPWRSINQRPSQSG